MANRGKGRKDFSRFVSARASARLVVYLFAEGETEVDYLQKIAKGRNIRVILQKRVSAPVRLLEAAVAWTIGNKRVLQNDKERNRIWVVFDDDAKAYDMEQVKKVWTKCPDICKTRISIGFMTPCIELWGLMCLDGGRGKYSLNRHNLQSNLHKQMPTYAHDAHPYFDISKMTRWEEACDRADNWAKTHGGFPECLNAGYFAGIAPLVREIMEAQRSDG